MTEGQAPAPAAAPSAPSSAPAKKSNATTIIIIVVIVVVVLGAGGYFISRWLARRAADKIASGILGAATGSNVSVNSDTGSVSVSNGSGTTAIGDSATWPAKMPSDVPKYTKGKITLSSSTADSWSVTISETNQSDYSAYKKLLESAGWTNTLTSTSDGEIASYEKGNYNLNLVFDSSSGGVSITVTTKA